MRMRLALAIGLAAGGLTLSACADDLYGPYGYGGGYYGAGYGGYYGGYGPYDSGYGYGYGYSPYYGAAYGPYYPFGWYGDFYYPGVGVYVYDSYRHPHVWNGDQQRYWSGRQAAWHSRTGSAMTHGNWSGFSRSSAGNRHHG